MSSADEKNPKRIVREVCTQDPKGKRHPGYETPANIPHKGVSLAGNDPAFTDMNVGEIVAQSGYFCRGNAGEMWAKNTPNRVFLGGIDAATAA